MCGRFTLAASKKQVGEHFSIEHDPNLSQLTPRYNIAPAQSIAVVRHLPEQPKRALSFMHWGLIPHWAKDKKMAYKMINAKVETLTERTAFRDAYRKRRCLIPADGFYEWAVKNNRKQPFYIHMHHGNVFALAGLWESWKGEREEIVSCTIITTDADEKVGKIHERMPVIISPEYYDQWLDPKNQNADSLPTLLESTDTSDIDYYPVTTAVNSPKNDGAELIQKFNNQA